MGNRGVAYETCGSFASAPDLAQPRFVAGYDFANIDSHANDDNSHSTHVAGAIAQSSNNSLGVAGKAPRRTIMPVKVLNSSRSGPSSAVAEGLFSLPITAPG